MSGKQATLTDSFGASDDSETQDPERRTRTPSTPDSPRDDQQDPATETDAEDAQEADENGQEGVPSPEEVDADRSDDGRETTPTGDSRGEWECSVCGESSEKCYRCTECGADMVAKT